MHHSHRHHVVSRTVAFGAISASLQLVVTDAVVTIVETGGFLCWRLRSDNPANTNSKRDLQQYTRG